MTEPQQRRNRLFIPFEELQQVSAYSSRDSEEYIKRRLRGAGFRDDLPVKRWEDYETRAMVFEQTWWESVERPGPVYTYAPFERWDANPGYPRAKGPGRTTFLPPSVDKGKDKTAAISTATSMVSGEISTNVSPPVRRVRVDKMEQEIKRLQKLLGQNEKPKQRGREKRVVDMS